MIKCNENVLFLRKYLGSFNLAFCLKRQETFCIFVGGAVRRELS